MATCPECGRPVPRSPGRGRPRRFDTDACRLASECRKRRRLYQLGAAVDRALREHL